ncbi:MAG: hypothetical protein JNL44_07170 [Gemmatimonadetes bacterium]|nr:hypothetical protein [Gemmatimonadota bacterium]
MLTYLDALIAALSVRDAAEVDRLLVHPLARILSADARAEVEAMRQGERDALAAPLRLMQLRHQTAELLRDATVVADRAEVPTETSAPTRAPRAHTPRVSRAVERPVARLVQMELPLSA